MKCENLLINNFKIIYQRMLSHREKYIQALRHADKGDYSYLYKFVIFHGGKSPKMC